MSDDLKKLRNIGISAHIDSGKTTLTERILFYTKRIHRIHEVKGKDGVGATMDSMELERERGITIASAATYCEWDGHHINIIDTPGPRRLHHRGGARAARARRRDPGALRRRRRAVAVAHRRPPDAPLQGPAHRLRQQVRPRRREPAAVVEQLREKLRHNAVLMQIPIGLEAKFEGVVDLVTMKAVRFEGENGETPRRGRDPGGAAPTRPRRRREELLDAASMFSDELTEAILEERVTEELIHDGRAQAARSRAS